MLFAKMSSKYGFMKPYDAHHMLSWLIQYNKQTERKSTKNQKFQSTGIELKRGEKIKTLIMSQQNLVLFML